MRSLLVVALFLLAGCKSSPDGLPDIPPPAPTATLDAVGAKEDKLDGRTAAAVQVAHDHADNPTIVKAETKVALAGLPKPTPGDLAYAEARALKADPKQYAADTLWATKAVQDIDRMWQTMEAEKAANLKAMSELKAHIDTLEKQVDQAKKDVWTYLGGAMVLLGALSLAFASKKGGAWLMLGGFSCGAFSMLLGTPWFLPAVAGLGLVSAVLAWVHFLRKPKPCSVDGPQEEDKNQGG